MIQVKTQILKGRNKFILDFDGVLYPISLFKVMHKAGPKLLEDIYHRHGSGRISKKAARYIAKAAYSRADLISLYIAFSKTCGNKGWRSTRQQVLEEIHSSYAKIFLNKYKHIDLYNQMLCQKMKECRALGVDFGIATNADIKSWTQHIAKRIGVFCFFNKRAIHDLSSCDFKSKFFSSYMVGQSAKGLGAQKDLSDCIFVDDNLGNLKTAKMGFPNLFTVYIGDASSVSQEQCKYVDLVCRSLEELLDQFIPQLSSQDPILRL